MKVTTFFDNLSDNEKKLFYLCNVKAVLNERAFFSDTTSEYRNPTEPVAGDEVAIRLRTAKYNVDRVILYANNEPHEMIKIDSDRIFDYYEATITVSNEKMYYYFEIISGKAVCFYNQIGATRDVNPFYNFEIIPGFKTPEWAKGIVMYQIFVDRFCNGDSTNDILDNEYSYLDKPVRSVKDWNRYPEDGIREFYGGDLQGVMDKLDYLTELGVEAVYFNPLFVSPSNHKYDIQDYDYIDPHFGVIISDKGELLLEEDTDNTHATRYIDRVTNKANLEASNRLFARLVEEMHKRGMKVIIDGVFNHCGSFNKWLDKEKIYETSKETYKHGAYACEESPYRTFFNFYGNKWPDNDSYDGWWGHNTLPKLNYEKSPQLEQYIIDVAKKWLLPPYNVDGWRLDVAADLGYNKEYNHRFWKRFRKEIKAVKPDALILAENYGDSHDWLQGDEWDTVMNYDAFMEPVTWFLTGMQKHSDEYREDMLGNADNFFAAMTHHMSRLGGQAYQISMNELSNHDHSRFLTRTNRTVGRKISMGSEAANNNINYAVFMEGVIIQMTWPGAPTIYYGDETGVCGWTDPDNRRTYPWGHENHQLIDFFKEAIKMRKENEALRIGSYKQLCSEYNLLVYGRFYKGESIIIVINNSTDERRVKIPAWEIGLGGDNDVEQIMATYDGTFSTERLGYSLPGGWLDFGIRGTSAVVLRKIQ